MESYSNAGFGLDFEYQDIISARDWMDCPEQRLVWAIIERCVRDVLGNQRAEILSAVEWLWEEDPQELEAFSFLWCCEALSVDPDALRKKILHTREQMNKYPLFTEDSVYTKAA